ncbi:hypothetical protein U1Q18_039147, partial [Sarracenia purpurea var. burkii]
FPFQSNSSFGPSSITSPSNTWLSPLLLFTNCPSVLPPLLDTHFSNALPHTHLPNTQSHQSVRPPAPVNDEVTVPNAPANDEVTVPNAPANDEVTVPAANNIVHDDYSVPHLSDAHDTTAAAPLSAALLNTAAPLSAALPNTAVPFSAALPNTAAPLSAALLNTANDDGSISDAPSSNIMSQHPMQTRSKS